MRFLLFFAFASLLTACTGTSQMAETPKASEQMQEIALIERAVLELVEFHIYDDPSGIRLYWATEVEENTALFHIERSGNGSVWEEIGTVAASGTTRERTPYRDLDEKPFSGNNFYRIVLETLDGAQQVSETKSIKHFGFFNLTLFPNPAAIGQQITLNFDGEEHHEFQVELVDKSGMRIQRESFESDWGTNQLSFVPAALSRGKYFVYVFLDDYPVQTFTLQLK
ncbi:MAG: hypothetical protein AB8F78_17185 [Saprospiraceae bacterium]